MRNALHVINSAEPKYGGTSVSVPGLMLATAETGRYGNHLIQFAKSRNQGQLGPQSVLTTLERSPIRVSFNMLLGGELSHAVSNADVVHIHGLWEPHCITTGVVARRQHKPVIISAHGMLESWALRNKIWKKWPYSLLVERPNLRRATVLRALTLAEAGDYRRYGLSNPIVLIPNGVDLGKKGKPDLFLSSWPELRGRRLVLYFSRIHYKKGIDLLVKAWAKVVTQFPDAHLVIAGQDFEGTQSTVEQLVQAYSLHEVVTFTGPLYGEMKASLLSAASLFVLPSHSEGFSVAVLESLAAGLPVIITKGCNFGAVRSSGAGWIISPSIGEIEGSLQEALALSNFDLKRRGDLGFQLVRSNYSWSSIGKQMADIYDWMLGGSRPTSVEMWE